MSQDSARYMKLLPAVTITVAVPAGLAAVIASIPGCRYMVVQAAFVYGSSGGTSADAYIQTTLDGGVTWVDVMNFHFLTTSAVKVSAVVATTALAAGVTPTDGSLAANSILSGLLGDMWRVKYVTTGTYVGATTLTVTGISKS